MGHTRTIGELRERSLHAGLKSWYALPRDRIEVPLEGYVIDLVRRGTLIARSRPAASGSSSAS